MNRLTHLPEIRIPNSKKSVSKWIQLLTQLQIFAFQKKATFIAYRLPLTTHSKEIRFKTILSMSKHQKEECSPPQDFFNPSPTFIFHAFDPEADPKNLHRSVQFFSADLIYDPLQREILFKASYRSSAEAMKKIIEDCLIRTQKIVPPKHRYPSSFLPPLVGNRNLTTSKENFKENVESALQMINASVNLRKIVLSRVKVIPQKTSSHQLLKLLVSSLNRHPNSFLSLVIDAEVGCWIGVSPELLIHQNQAKVLTTVALAGTQWISSKKKIEDIKWRTKEIEEQAMVRQHIVDWLAQHQFKKYHEYGPRTIRAGDLLHLSSQFQIDPNFSHDSHLTYAMILQLHPTPAVCGTPKLAALDWIRRLELHQRKFYSGFLGPIGIDDEMHLYVNLRCAEIGPEETYLYSGAGIIHRSRSEEELIETEHKLKTIENLLLESRSIT